MLFRTCWTNVGLWIPRLKSLVINTTFQHALKILLLVSKPAIPPFHFTDMPFVQALKEWDFDVMMNAVSLVARHIYNFEEKVWPLFASGRIKPVVNKVKDSEGPPDFWASEYAKPVYGTNPAAAFPTANERRP